MTTRLLRMRELASTSKRQGVLPCSSPTIWRLVKSGDFPQPFKIGENCTVWDAAEVEAYIERKRNEPRGGNQPVRKKLGGTP